MVSKFPNWGCSPFTMAIYGEKKVGLRTARHDCYKITKNFRYRLPKMEVLNLRRLFCGWVFPYIGLTYS